VRRRAILDDFGGHYRLPPQARDPTGIEAGGSAASPQERSGLGSSRRTVPSLEGWPVMAASNVWNRSDDDQAVSGRLGCERTFCSLASSSRARRGLARGSSSSISPRVHPAQRVLTHEAVSEEAKVAVRRSLSAVDAVVLYRRDPRGSGGPRKAGGSTRMERQRAGGRRCVAGRHGRPRRTPATWRAATYTGGPTAATRPCRESHA
jgi:hypothetical protein